MEVAARARSNKRITGVGTEQFAKDLVVALVVVVGHGESAAFKIFWHISGAHIVYTDVCLRRGMDAGT